MWTRAVTAAAGPRARRVRAGPLSPTPTVDSAAARRRRSAVAERYYVGRRPRATEVYVVTGDEVGPLGHPAYRSDAPLDWGDRSAGALELAFALLACSTGRRPPDAICLVFQRDVVARLDHPGFVLSDGEIALWLLSTFGDHDPGRASLPPRSGLWRPVDWLRGRRRRG